jgi:hypothetical protein
MNTLHALPCCTCDFNFGPESQIWPALVAGFVFRCRIKRARACMLQSIEFSESRNPGMKVPSLQPIKETARGYRDG